MRLFRRLLVVALFSASASPAFAQRAISHAWLDLDEAFITPTQDAQAYSSSLRLFDEIATASVEYPTLAKSRRPAFGGGVQIYRGLGVGVRVTAAERQTTPAAITVTIPDPVFFNRPHIGRAATPLERTERTLDLQAVYVLPMPSPVSVRVFAGRSRTTIAQSLIQHVTYQSGSAGVSIVDVSEQTANEYAWGSLVGVDAGLFLLRNIGVGVELAHRSVDIPQPSEPFSGKSFALSAHRVQITTGLRIRF